MYSKLCLLLCIKINVNAEPITAGKEMDYTDLAGEIETHKQDLLEYLNQAEVQAQYKSLYNNLLSKLMGKFIC